MSNVSDKPRVLEPVLSRSKTNRPISLSILLFLLSNRLLKITAPTTRGVSTPRSNNRELWLISQFVVRIRYLSMCDSVVPSPFFSPLIFSSLFVHNDSYTKLKKFDQCHVWNISCQWKYIHWFGFIEKNGIKWIKQYYKWRDFINLSHQFNKR